MSLPPDLVRFVEEEALGDRERANGLRVVDAQVLDSLEAPHERIRGTHVLAVKVDGPRRTTARLFIVTVVNRPRSPDGLGYRHLRFPPDCGPQLARALIEGARWAESLGAA